MSRHRQRRGMAGAGAWAPAVLALTLWIGVGPGAGSTPARGDWSPDGRWLIFTTAAPREDSPWLSRKPPVRAGIGSGTGPGGGVPAALGMPLANFPRERFAEPDREAIAFWRLWAHDTRSGRSALLAESAEGLSEPVWNRDGTAIFYCRIARDHEGNAGWELVVQNAPDTARVLRREPISGALPSLEKLRRSRPSVSRDGEFLAVPHPEWNDVLVVDARTGQLVVQIDDSDAPAWSPTSPLLALMHRDPRTDRRVLEVHDPLGNGRIATFNQGSEAAFPFVWASDGRTLMFARTFSEPEASRVNASLMRLTLMDRRMQSETILSFGARPDRLREFAMTISDDQELMFFAADSAERPTQITEFYVSNKVTRAKFDAIDHVFPPAELDLSFEDRLLMVRYRGGPTGVSPPIVHDPATRKSTLVAPDEATRALWGAWFLDAVEELTRTELPTPTREGLPVSRAHPIPARWEMPDNAPTRNRLRRLSELGLGIVESGGDAGGESRATLDARLALSILAERDDDAAKRIEERTRVASDPTEVANLHLLRIETLIREKRYREAELSLAYWVEETREPSRYEDFDRLGFRGGDGRSKREGWTWAEYLEGICAEARGGDGNPGGVADGRAGMGGGVEVGVEGVGFGRAGAIEFDQ